LRLQGFDLDHVRIAAVLDEFTRIHAIASAILDHELPMELDQAPVFRR